MKILCINIKPDFTWFTSKGLKLDVILINETSVKLPLIEVACNRGNFYTPDVRNVANKYNGYNVIMVGWSPKDYDKSVLKGAGYTYPDKQPNGARLISVRVDDKLVSMYPLHEMMHTLGNIINIDFGDHVPKDFMDMTPVNGIWKSYYINDPFSNDPNSNFNQTWKNYLPFLDKLNNMNKYKYFSEKEIVGLKPELVEKLDKMREECGFPFKINSGFRTKEQNDKLKDAVVDSAHTTGEAVDIACTDSTKRMKMISSAFTNGISRIGIADTYLHLDIDKTKPQKVIWLY